MGLAFLGWSGRIEFLPTVFEYRTFNLLSMGSGEKPRQPLRYEMNQPSAQGE
jgi:hypothetical protein